MVFSFVRGTRGATRGLYPGAASPSFASLHTGPRSGAQPGGSRQQIMRRSNVSFKLCQQLLMSDSPLLGSLQRLISLLQPSLEKQHIIGRERQPVDHALT